MNDYIEFSNNKKQAQITLKCFYNYWNTYGVKGNILKVIKRDKHIMDLNEKNYTFIEYLKDNVKNPASRNLIISQLAKYFDYLIINESSLTNKRYDNPVIYKYDKFKAEKKHSTYRKALPEKVILYMQELLLKNDFEFTRTYFKEDIKDRLNIITNKIDKDVISLNSTFIIYLMLVLPLRSKQAICLDNGLLDEFIYIDGVMVKNKYGIKKRKQGFVQMGFYTGVSKKSKELLYINTNKGNSGGFYIPWISPTILELVKVQKEWLGKYEIGLDKIDHLKRSNDLQCRLFMENGKDIYKAKLYRFWKVLCKVVEMDLGIELIKNGKCVYDLHSLRVSGVSSAIEGGMNLGNLSNYFVGHHSGKMTLHYNSVDNLDDYIKKAEQNKDIKLLELGGMDEI
jgi:hypothetical protein